MADFTLHGVTRIVDAVAKLTFVEETELTNKRAPGDLLSVEANFKIKLSDYGIRHMLIGTRVADEIEISTNIVGSNSK